MRFLTKNIQVLKSFFVIGMFTFLFFTEKFGTTTFFISFTEVYSKSYMNPLLLYGYFIFTLLFYFTLSFIHSRESNKRDRALYSLNEVTNIKAFQAILLALHLLIVMTLDINFADENSLYVRYGQILISFIVLSIANRNFIRKNVLRKSHLGIYSFQLFVEFLILWIFIRDYAHQIWDLYYG